MKKALVFLFLSIQIFAQKPVTLPRSTPETEGVDSDGISQFYEAVAQSKMELHSFMLIRHGKVVAENWWNPYSKDLKHTLYSCSKSFTATAVGFAISEKKLNLSDKVISFFPDDLPATISPNLAALEIRHLLTMSVGHEKENSTIIATTDNWVEGFLATPIVHKPGTKFLYNSPGTYMLSAIVQKVTGQKIIDYLKPLLFDPLGIQNIDWETDPKGINTGGWGLRLKTDDMAKFGQLFLQKGKWNGKQILPKEWVEDASAMHIMQNPDAPQAQKDASDWLQGYGYQMWRCRNNGYRADGANGQFIIILPEKDAVIVLTAEETNMQSEINLVWKYVFPALKDKKLASNTSAYNKLKEQMSKTALPIVSGTTNVDFEKNISSKSFGVFSKGKSLKNVSFVFQNNICSLKLETDSVTHTIPFGFGKWEQSNTSKLGPYLVARGRNNRVGLWPYKVAGSYTWNDAKTLELTLRYIESPHTETILCSFEGDSVKLDFKDLFNKNAKRPITKAIVVNSKANPAKLIIRGDDMGYTHSGNLALIKSQNEGIQTSIEVIVPSPWFPEAVKMFDENKGIDVGLHFAITSEWDNVKWRPLTEAKSLRNPDGYFYPMLYHNNNYPNLAVTDNKWDIADYEKELRAQIEMAKKYIPRVSHISGHMGALSFAPEIKALCMKIGKEYGLPMVDAGSTDIQYVGYDSRNKSMDEKIAAFIKMLDKLEDGKAYVFVEHPGLDDEELRAVSHIGYENVATDRQDVTNLFTSEKVKAAIVQRGIKLMSYKEVLNGK